MPARIVHLCKGCSWQAVCTAPTAARARKQHLVTLLQELDEAEVEEARRRRQQFENDDSEMCVSPPHHPDNNRRIPD